MQVLGAGVGRTGTYSLKLALNQLGLGPCHHMEEVIQNMSTQVPLWADAVAGRADWPKVFDGYTSAVDWPTAGFYRELIEAFPGSRFVLTIRSPESWADSFEATIYKLMTAHEEAPPEKREWLDMVLGVLERTGFPLGLDRDALIAAFAAHNDAVQAEIPASQLLVFEVRDGWEPLCEFLDVDVPREPFPRSNDRLEFWDKVQGGAD